MDGDERLRQISGTLRTIAHIYERLRVHPICAHAGAIDTGLRSSVLE